MLSIQNVTYTKCYQYEMLPRRNVTIRKCTIRNVTDPWKYCTVINLTSISEPNCVSLWINLCTKQTRAILSAQPDVIDTKFYTLQMFIEI